MDSIVVFQKRSGANALPLESIHFSALASPSSSRHSFVVDLSLAYHERYLEWRQAEYAQLHVRATTMEKLEEVIQEGELVVFAFHEAYLRVLDYADYM